MRHLVWSVNRCPFGVPLFEAVGCHFVSGRRGARGRCTTVTGEHAAVHEPLPMIPLVIEGDGKGGDGGGVDRVRKVKEKNG